jgi:hypothetical protein
MASRKRVLQAVMHSWQKEGVLAVMFCWQKESPAAVLSWNKERR